MELKEIIKKIKKYKNIRFVSNKLFASENGFLEFDCKISQVVTNPNNKFIINNNEIKFLGSCEVLNINMEDGFFESLKEPTQKNNYFHFENNLTANNNTDLNKTVDLQLDESINPDNVINNNNQHAQEKFVVILDTNTMNLSSLNVNNYKKGITATRSGRGNDIVMNSKTSLSININCLKPNATYNICVEGERLRGNGKLKIGFDIKNLADVVLGERRAEVNVVIKTGDEKNNSLVISRMEGSIGLVSIKRILIKEIQQAKQTTAVIITPNSSLIQNSSLNNIKQQNEKFIRQTNKVNDNIKETKTIKKNYDNLFLKKSESKISEISKQNAVYYKQDFEPTEFFDLEFSVAPVTLSSRRWVSKILPLLPNLNIYNKILSFRDVKRSNTINLSLCSIDNIIQSQNIFIEEWVGEIKNNESIEILKKSNKIFVSSLINMIELKSILNNVEIIQTSKFWPSLQKSNYKELNERYFVYFEKDKDATKNLINSFNNDLYRLVVVGSRLKLPDNIIQYSEYDDYKTIVNLLHNSLSLIDISKNNYYNSSIINFAIRHNIPVITNNNFYNKNSEIVSMLRGSDTESINHYFNNASVPSFDLKIDTSHNAELKNIILKMIG